MLRKTEKAPQGRTVLAYPFLLTESQIPGDWLDLGLQLTRGEEKDLLTINVQTAGDEPSSLPSTWQDMGYPIYWDAVQRRLLLTARPLGARFVDYGRWLVNYDELRLSSADKPSTGDKETIDRFVAKYGLMLSKQDVESGYFYAVFIERQRQFTTDYHSLNKKQPLSYDSLVFWGKMAMEAGSVPTWPAGGILPFASLSLLANVLVNHQAFRLQGNVGICAHCNSPFNKSNQQVRYPQFRHCSRPECVLWAKREIHKFRRKTDEAYRLSNNEKALLRQNRKRAR